MDHFHYQNGRLACENVKLDDIAAAVGTPVYVYSNATLKRHYTVFRNAFDGLDALVCFAVKANSNQAVLATLAHEGAGADVVSEGELKRALMAGIPAERIVFSGVGKTPHEMRLALEAGIKQFNVESENELKVLSRVATDMGKTAPVSLRINPDVDAQTHAKISTGKSENKFGIPWQHAKNTYALIKALPSVKAVGVDIHIGSQLTDLTPFRAAFEKTVALVRELRGLGHNLKHIDLGGGLGIPYEPGAATPPNPSAYGDMVKDVLGDLDCSIILEPGRLIAGNAGVLLTQLIYAKRGAERTFYILDAAMNDLTRPALYDAYHDIIPVEKSKNGAATHLADFVGPVCETGDTFAKKRETTHLTEGDLLAIKSAGAYGAVMSSTYNSRPLIAEVLVEGDQYCIIRQRQSVEELIGLDTLPNWLK